MHESDASQFQEVYQLDDLHQGLILQLHHAQKGLIALQLQTLHGVVLALVGLARDARGVDGNVGVDGISVETLVLLVVLPIKGVGVSGQLKVFS